jgi:hypothetical protein
VSDVPQPVRVDAALVRHARRQARGVELDPHDILHALSEMVARLMQTPVPDTQLPWQASPRASGGVAIERTATAMATRVAESADRMVRPSAVIGEPPARRDPFTTVRVAATRLKC